MKSNELLSIPSKKTNKHSSMNNSIDYSNPSISKIQKVKQGNLTKLEYNQQIDEIFNGFNDENKQETNGIKIKTKLMDFSSLLSSSSNTKSNTIKNSINYSEKDSVKKSPKRVANFINDNESENDHQLILFSNNTKKNHYKSRSVYFNNEPSS